MHHLVPFGLLNIGVRNFAVDDAYSSVRLTAKRKPGRFRVRDGYPSNSTKHQVAFVINITQLHHRYWIREPSLLNLNNIDAVLRVVPFIQNPRHWWIGVDFGLRYAGTNSLSWQIYEVELPFLLSFLHFISQPSTD